MPLPRPLPAADELRRLFSYDPSTGALTWKYRPEYSVQWNGKHAGQRAGGRSKAHGRLVVNIGGRLILCHRIVWKIVHGGDPIGDLDHKDGDPANNRIENLRPATKHENLRNSRLHVGKTLPKGVSEYDHNRFRASIYIDGRCRHLGVFASAEGAHAAYCREAAKHFGEFARFA